MAISLNAIEAAFAAIELVNREIQPLFSAVFYDVIGQDGRHRAADIRDGRWSDKALIAQFLEQLQGTLNRQFESRTDQIYSLEHVPAATMGRRVFALSFYAVNSPCAVIVIVCECDSPVTAREKSNRVKQILAAAAPRRSLIARAWDKVAEWRWRN